jgi:hypothetical protein
MFKINRPTIEKPNLKNKRALVLAVCLILVVVGVGWTIAGDKFKDNRKVYAEAAGHKIYEQEVRDLVGSNKEINDYDAAKVLADKYLTQSLAKEQNILVSDQEMETEFGKAIQKQKSENKFAYQNKLNQLYFDKLQAHHRGIYKGNYIIAHFSRNVEFHPVLPEDKAKNPNLGNRGAIEKDKKYAENFINRLYKDVKSQKITFDEAVNIERKDQRLGINTYPTLPHSGNFDTSLRGNPVINLESIKERVQNIHPGDLTEPFVVRTGNSLDGKSTAEAYFLLIEMEESSAGEIEGTFDQYLEKAMERLDYAVYV